MRFISSHKNTKKSDTPLLKQIITAKFYFEVLRKIDINFIYQELNKGLTVEKMLKVIFTICLNM